LEPEEIGRLYQEKRAILESIREGVVSIDSHGIITMANQTACHMFGLSDGFDLSGQHIEAVAPNLSLLTVVRTGRPVFDQQIIIANQDVVANTLPVLDQRGRVIGAVSSFRNKSELNRLIEELSQVREYAEALRAQTHEYSNKLYTISGLIQLESYREAIEFITHESGVHQNLLQFVMKEIPDPLIGGFSSESLTEPTN
jgi:two-component system, CitB family, sensor kinase